MTVNRRQCLLHSAAALGISTLPDLARAQTYPSRPVRVVVPFAPGGPTDLVGRVLAQGLTEQFGQPFNVENVGGAGGNIGVGQVARAAPDGHTLLVAAASYAVNPSLFEKVPYDPANDFSVVTFAATAGTVMVVHPSIGAKTVKELIAMIRAQPGKHSYASPGPGTPPHLVGEMFRLAFHLDLLHVPFNGGGPALASTLAGHTPISFAALPPAVPHVREGKLRALAVTSRSRSTALPDTPTMADEGYPDIAADIWQAVLVPAATSREIVLRLHRGIVTVTQQPEVRDRMAGLGYFPVVTTPDESEEEMRREISKWAKVVRDARIKLQ